MKIKMSDGSPYLSRERRKLYSKLWKSVSSTPNLPRPASPPLTSIEDIKKHKCCVKCGNEDCSCQNECQCEEEINEAKAIDYSIRVVVALEEKIKEFKEEGFKKKISIDQLRTVFRKGWQLTKSNESGMVRVNIFLDMLRGKKEFAITGKNFICDNLLDVSQSWEPTEDCIQRSKEDIEKYNLDFKVEDVKELYLDDYDKISSYWEE